MCVICFSQRSAECMNPRDLNSGSAHAPAMSGPRASSVSADCAVAFCRASCLLLDRQKRRPRGKRGPCDQLMRVGGPALCPAPQPPRLGPPRGCGPDASRHLQLSVTCELGVQPARHRSWGGGVRSLGPLPVSVCPSVHPSVCPSTHLSMRPSICPSAHQFYRIELGRGGHEGGEGISYTIVGEKYPMLISVSV